MNTDEIKQSCMRCSAGMRPVSRMYGKDTDPIYQCPYCGYIQVGAVDQDQIKQDAELLSNIRRG